MTDTEQTQLAQRLKETRELLNLSQQFVSEQTELSRSAISDIERGARRVEATELAAFARLYRFPVGYFLGQVDTEQEAPADMQALLRTAQELPDEDREQMLRYAMFLRHFRQGEGK